MDQSLTDLIKRVATEFENGHPGTPHTGNDPPCSHVDPTNSPENSPAIASNSAPVMKAAESQSSTVGRKPRVRLMKMNVWFTEDDVTLIRKISAARGQNAADFIQAATLKLLAELGAVGEERRRLLITLRG